MDLGEVFLPDARGVIEGLAEEDRRNLRPSMMRRLLTSHAIEAGYKADPEWFNQHLGPSRRRDAAYPLAVVTQRGPQALLESPWVTVGKIHSVKGGQATLFFCSPT